MKRVKLLHCADIHLDMPFTSIGNRSGRSITRRQELKQVFSKIISIAKEECIDLLLICGDLFEHTYVKKSTITFINDQFTQIPEVEVLIIPGNHDPYLSDSYYKTFKWSDNVHILYNPSQFVNLYKLGVCVYGNGSYEEPVNPDNVNILMAHGTLDMSFAKDSYNPLSGDKLAASGMDYVALGHFHNMFKEAGTRKLCFNPGSPEPLGFDEEHEHGIFLVTIVKTVNNEKEIDLRFITLNRRYYRNININVDGCSNDESIINKVCEAIIASGTSEDLYNVSLKGTVANGFRINTGWIEESLNDKAFFIKIKDETKPDYDLDELKKEPGLKGLFIRKMLERAENAENAGDENAKMIIMQALYYGIEAIDQGEINVY